jgi:hypothetical protein
VRLHAGQAQVQRGIGVQVQRFARLPHRHQVLDRRAILDRVFAQETHGRHVRQPRAAARLRVREARVVGICARGNLDAARIEARDLAHDSLGRALHPREQRDEAVIAARRDRGRTERIAFELGILRPRLHDEARLQRRDHVAAHIVVRRLLFRGEAVDVIRVTVRRDHRVQAFVLAVRLATRGDVVGDELHVRPERLALRRAARAGFLRQLRAAEIDEHVAVVRGGVVEPEQEAISESDGIHAQADALGSFRRHDYQSSRRCAPPVARFKCNAANRRTPRRSLSKSPDSQRCAS